MATIPTKTADIASISNTKAKSTKIGLNVTKRNKVWTALSTVI